MEDKKDYRTSAIDNILTAAEYGDTVEYLQEGLKEAAALPYYARAYIAYEIQNEFAKRITTLNTNAKTINKIAALDVERIRFVTDTLGKKTNLAARIFAFKALGGPSPAADSLFHPSENPTLALCETAKIVHGFSHGEDVTRLVKALDTAEPGRFPELISEVLQQEKLTRLFIAEALEAPFLLEKRRIALDGADILRNRTALLPLNMPSCAANALILELIVKIKGDATPLFIETLARDTIPFRSERNAGGKAYIEVFLNAYEKTEEGSEFLTQVEEDQQRAAKTQIDKLKSLRPAKPSLRFSP